MNINVEHQPNCRAALHVEVTADTVKKQRAQITQQYANSARVPGYRPGKTPVAVIAQRYKETIDGELQNQLINKGCREAIEKENLVVLQVLSVKDTKLDKDGTFSFSAEVLTSPKFELPEYTGIPVKLERVEVTDHDIEHELYHLRERQQTFTDVERPAALGDAVVLNFIGKMDGKPLDETHPDLPVHFRKIDGNWFLLAEVEDFVPGFYAGLLGIKGGESRTLSLALPEDFHNDELKGKTLEFEINCTEVKEKTVPPLDDAFAATALGEGATVDTLKKEVADSLRHRREQAREQSRANQVLAFLHDKLDFDLPQEVVEREAQRRTNDMAMRAAKNGMAQDEIMKHQDEIVNAASQQARQNVKVSFILEEIAKKENLTVGEQQLSFALANWASRSKMPFKKFLGEAKKNGLIDKLREDLLLENAVEFLKTSAVVEEVDAADDKHDCAFEGGEEKPEELTAGETKAEEATAEEPAAEEAKAE
ncbi:MAG: Trigger factor [Verrucomicrobiaceae bacterium]|nr:Trigger factor [Verrucomicrobiaceae bacterium]